MYPNLIGVGVHATITWNKSVSDDGTFTYTVKRNHVNSSATATTISGNIASGIQTFTDTSVNPYSTYYYFIEVSNGTSTVISTGYQLITVAG